MSDDIWWNEMMKTFLFEKINSERVVTGENGDLLRGSCGWIS